MLAYARNMNNGKVLHYLPDDEKEIHKPPRSYIGNVIYTIMGDDFNHWVKMRTDERNAKVVKEKEMMIDMDPEIA